jgi:hypothetical protein
MIDDSGYYSDDADLSAYWSGYFDYIQVHNPTDAEVDLAAYSVAMCVGGCASGPTFESGFAFASGATIAAGGTYLICDGEFLGYYGGLDESNTGLSLCDEVYYGGFERFQSYYHKTTSKDMTMEILINSCHGRRITITIPSET